MKNCSGLLGQSHGVPVPNRATTIVAFDRRSATSRRWTLSSTGRVPGVDPEEAVCSSVVQIRNAVFVQQSRTTLGAGRFPAERSVVSQAEGPALIVSEHIVFSAYGELVCGQALYAAAAAAYGRPIIMRGYTQAGAAFLLNFSRASNCKTRCLISSRVRRTVSMPCPLGSGKGQSSRLRPET